MFVAMITLPRMLPAVRILPTV
eukprot:SAG11_NODE_36084_length_263_cov_0.939024_1_plen_21_part_01